jgi:uncharacterized protein with HEPN domain
MSAHDPQVTLRQIQEAAGRLQTICNGKTLEQLLADWQATAALERFIELIGEGVKRLPMKLRDLYPIVPWKEIAGTRDRLSHGYDDVEYQVLWDAVQKDLPVLLATVERMLQDFPAAWPDNGGSSPT